MTIRLEKTNGITYANSRGVRLVIQSIVAVDTEAEALEAKRAFENVLAPRFTRDEAIAIVLETMPEPVDQACEHHLRGIRLALEALAAAGAFSDCGGEGCEQAPELCIAVMRGKLDAAGIR